MLLYQKSVIVKNVKLFFMTCAMVPDDFSACL